MQTTAGPIIARAAVQCGILSLSQSSIASYDPWTSTDANVVLLIDLLRTVGTRIAKRVSAGRIREATITTAASATSYAVETDYDRMVDGTAWDRSGTRRLYGPVTPQFDAWFKAWNGGTGAFIPFRLQDRKVEFPIAPADGLTLKYQYVSAYWAQASGSPSPDKAYPTVRTDAVCFDDELVILGLRLAWLEQKGFDTEVVAKRFADALDQAVGVTAGGATLSLNGAGFEERLVDGRNLPVAGWGT